MTKTPSKPLCPPHRLILLGVLTLLLSSHTLAYNPYDYPDHPADGDSYSASSDTSSHTDDYAQIEASRQSRIDARQDELDAMQSSETHPYPRMRTAIPAISVIPRVSQPLQVFTPHSALFTNAGPADKDGWHTRDINGWDSTAQAAAEREIGEINLTHSAIPDRSAATIPRAVSSSSYSTSLMLRYGMLLWCVIFFLWVLTRSDDALAGVFGFFSRVE